MIANITDHFPPGEWINSPEGQDAIGHDAGEILVVQVKSARARLVAQISAVLPELADEIERVNA